MDGLSTGQALPGALPFPGGRRADGNRPGAENDPGRTSVLDHESRAAQVHRDGVLPVLGMVGSVPCRPDLDPSPALRLQAVWKMSGHRAFCRPADLQEARRRAGLSGDRPVPPGLGWAYLPDGKTGVRPGESHPVRCVRAWPVALDGTVHRLRLAAKTPGVASIRRTRGRLAVCHPGVLDVSEGADGANSWSSRITSQTSRLS
jgi:hypothetical protein